MTRQHFLRRAVTIALIGLCCGGVITAFLKADLFKGIKNKTADFRFLCRGAIKTSDKIVIIGTDEEALENIADPFIFWSPYFADIIKALAAGGAKAIGLDFLQTIALNKRVDDKDLDGIMTEALMDAENVIMINLLRWDETTKNLKAINPLPCYLHASDPDNVGFSNLTIDNDGCVRRQTLLLNDYEGNIYAYIGLKVIAKYLDSPIEKKGDCIYVGNYKIPVNSYNEMLINFAGPSGTFPILSFYKVLQMAQQGNADFFADNFKDKIVLIGPGNIYSQDFKPTPYYRSNRYSGTRQTLGIEIVANVTNTILERLFIVSAQQWQVILVILFFTVLTSFTSFKLSPLSGGIVTFAVAAGYIYLCIVLFNRYNLLLDLIYPITGIPLAYTAVFAYRYTIEDKEKRKIKRIFKHYVSEEVVEELLQYTGEIPLGGNRVHATVLFSDIRSFTSMSERQDPQQTVGILNEYFSTMADIILKNKGTLDKYIGDGILAFFGAPVKREEHADLAVRTAIEMITQLEVLNKKLALDNPLEIGIGIHSGDAVVGNIGSKLKMEYTIIGDTVNTASRIEGLTKELKAGILITEATFSRLTATYNIVPEREITLRGKTKPILIYSVKVE
jgi:adenylate cyclase